jgi:hypothetical protein
MLLEDTDLYKPFVMPESKFESILAGEGKLHKYLFTIASAYLDSESDIKLLPAKLEDKFLKALQVTLSEGTPLITLHPIAPLATLHTEQRLNRSAVKINALTSEISKRGLLHVSIFSNLNYSKTIFDFIPLGDIVLSEPRIDSRTLNSLNSLNSLSSLEKILVDLSVCRKELKEVLGNLLSFFAN